MPIGFSGVGRLHVTDLDRRHVADGGHQVVHEVRVDAAGRRRRTRAPPAASRPAPATTPPCTWPVDDQRVDQRAGVVHDVVAQRRHDRRSRGRPRPPRRGWRRRTRCPGRRSTRWPAARASCRRAAASPARGRGGELGEREPARRIADDVDAPPPSTMSSGSASSMCAASRSRLLAHHDRGLAHGRAADRRAAARVGADAVLHEIRVARAGRSRRRCRRRTGRRRSARTPSRGPARAVTRRCRRRDGRTARCGPSRSRTGRAPVSST